MKITARVSLCLVAVLAVTGSLWLAAQNAKPAKKAAPKHAAQTRKPWGRPAEIHIDWYICGPQEQKIHVDPAGKVIFQNISDHEIKLDVTPKDFFNDPSPITVQSNGTQQEVVSKSAATGATYKFEGCTPPPSPASKKGPQHIFTDPNEILVP